MKSLNVLMMGRGRGQVGVTSGNGYLYNQYAIKSADFAPPNWYIIPDSWYLNYASGAIAGEALSKGSIATHWLPPTYSFAEYPGTFNALGSGSRANNGEFKYLKVFFSMFSLNGEQAGTISLYYDDPDVVSGISGSNEGHSVRLIYSGPAPAPTSVTDYDGNVYGVSIVNGASVTKQNWKCTRMNNGAEIPMVQSNSIWSTTTSPARCVYNNNMAYL